jgi:hypothetical protein
LLSLYPPFSPSDGERVRERLLSGTRYLFGHLNFGVHRIVAVDAKYITLLREPVSRVLSYYRHQRTRPDAPYHGHIKKGLSLKQFVAERISFETNNHMTRILAGHTGQGYLDDESVLDAALANLSRDFLGVGLTERFEESVRLILTALGWNDQAAGLALPRLNRSPDRSPVTLDSATRAAILRDNRLDARLYRTVAAAFPRLPAAP